ncbi:hypothetical protein ACQEVC_35030 [Plantactinospora sp. CA-294935]|uniref:hypothetical protein n=1 Tax=Plantactinospora sp. CA-294935 TaxID=3240012 RepID=UPI003D90F06A
MRTEPSGWDASLHDIFSPEATFVIRAGTSPPVITGCDELAPEPLPGAGVVAEQPATKVDWPSAAMVHAFSGTERGKVPLLRVSDANMATITQSRVVGNA